MKKFLFCGDVNSQWTPLLERVGKLQASAHGPFDALFCTGTFFENEDEYFKTGTTLEFPIPTFVIDWTGFSDDFKAPKNVTFLSAAGLELLCGVRVCSLTKNAQPEQVDELLKRFADPNYKGCDILVSGESPSNVLQLLSEVDYHTAKALGIPLSGGSDTVARVAYNARPRMHFTGALNICYERSPYKCHEDGSSDIPTHDNCTFFYSLAGLPGGKNTAHTGDEKSRRWLKAMSCEPMAAVGSRLRPLPAASASTVTDNPYADVFAPKIAVGQKRPRDINETAGNWKPPPPPNPPPGSASTSFFFGESRGPRGGNKGPHGVNSVPPSTDVMTLFVGGIPPMPADAVEELLLPLFPNATRINGVNDKPFAFVEFATHDSAAAVLNDHTSGKTVISLPSDIGGGGPLSLGWGKAKNTNDSGRHNRPDRIPASHSDDCWFCLASPVVKVHLVVSVSDSAYLSLPRGGMSDLHVLAIPIECNPNRLHVSDEARRDLDRYCVAVDKMYESVNCRLLCYERAIRTKGKDHMQLHCVPVPTGMLSRSVSIFLEFCSKFKLKFQEIMDSASVEDTVNQLAPHVANPEYFYISIPVGLGEGQKKRFIYIHEPGTYFKMHFGSEVAANIIGQPDRANWKNCAQEEPQEMELATKFREAFEKFDFTLSP